MKDKVLVLFSGGQDSTVCLAWALEKFSYVETIGFNYGQRHAVELECRSNIIFSMRKTFPSWSDRLGKDTLINLEFINDISETALTRDIEIRMNENGLPSTFVPGRNLFFITTAAAHAYRSDINTLVTGVCETDYSGYPDCRNSFIKSCEETIALAMECKFHIMTPLMYLNKAQTWELAKKLGKDSFLNILIEDTHTCYKGDRTLKHEWGYGCGSCFACKIRAKGWNEFVHEN